MTALERWLEREQRRQGRRPELLSALIAGRGLAYARHRLGFMALRLLVRTALHILEVWFLSRALPFPYLAPLLSYRALASLATNLHWGATESLREAVRTNARARRPAAARAAVEAWLAGCSLLALPPVAFIALRIVGSAAAHGGIGLSLFDAYALACALRLLAEVIARTYHAGVFALHRVYRPLSSLLLADLLEVGFILACFDSLGPWSIALSIALGGAVDSAFTLRYARAAYLRHRMLLPRWRAAFRIRARPAVATIERALAHALAGASLQLDAWLLLLLIRVDPPRRAAPSLALLYYVLRPLLSLSTHWVRTFYFDLIHLDAGGLRAFRPHLLRLLRRLAIAAALLGAGLTLMAARLLWPSFALGRLIAFVPFFAARSLFALTQLAAFARGCIRSLVWTSLALAAGLSLLTLARSGALLLWGAALLLALGAFALRERSGGWMPRSEQRVLGIAEWLRSLRDADQVRIGVVRVARRSAAAGRVLETLASDRPELVLTRHAGAHLLLMAAADALPSTEALVALGAGALDRVWLSPVCRGRDSVTLARAERALPPELSRALDPDANDRTGSLVSDFERTFSQGSVLDLAAGTGALAPSQCPKSLLGEFVQQLTAASHQRERDARARLPCELAVYAPAGQTELVFVVPRGSRGFAQFRARVRAASLHASFYPRPIEQRPDRSESSV